MVENFCAVFKRVEKREHLIVGNKYIDERKHKIYVLADSFGVGSLFEFHDIDDENDRVIMQFSEIRNNLRMFDLSEFELRSLLCSLMIEVLELMLIEKNKK